MHLRKDELFSLICVSEGKEPADLILEGGRIVNVYTGEIQDLCSVAIKGKWIVGVGKDLSFMSGPKTHCVNIKQKYIVPGFIDAHAHILPYCHPHDFLNEAVKKGVTTVVTELLDFSFKVKIEDMINYLKATKGQAAKVFAFAPSFISLCENAKRKVPDKKKILELLRREEILGVGESFWQEVLRGNSPLFDILPYISKRKKTVEGHSAGCKGQKLQRYVLAGALSCHEPTTKEEVLERLRLGLYVMVREGSVRSDIGSISSLKESRIDTRRIILVSDFISPDEILEKGYMDYVVNRAIDAGIDPVCAIQMVTLNPATYFNLDRWIGGIAPGRYADIVVTPEIRRIEPELVVSNGKIVIKDGEFNYNAEKKPLRIKGIQRPRVTPYDLLIRSDMQQKKLRIIELVTDLVTKEAFWEAKVVKGEIKADPKNDIAKISFVTEDGCYNYFIKGTGLKEGALATTSIWEACGILAIGIDENEMAYAINRILENGGGIVVVKEGKVLEELPLPIGSMISDLPFHEVAKKIRSINALAKTIGMRVQKPIIFLETLTSPAIPFLRVSDRGLIDLKTGSALNLFVDSN